MNAVRFRRALRVVAVAGAAILAGTVATTASAAVRPRTAPRVVTVTRGVAQVRMRIGAGTSARALTGATAGTPQGPAHFDLDGDGIDEIVAGAACDAIGYCMVVRYSRSGRIDEIGPASPAAAHPY